MCASVYVYVQNMKTIAHMSAVLTIQLFSSRLVEQLFALVMGGSGGNDEGKNYGLVDNFIERLQGKN